MPHVTCQCQDLACARGGRLLWRGLTFTLSGGDALHITGSNGIGKSSLLRIIAGLLPPASGTVEAEAPIALLDETTALDRDRPLIDALGFWAGIDGVPAGTTAGDVMAALDRVGLAALAQVPPRMFSTGQRKRAALARLIVQRARLWLLDEPMNGLDSDGVDRLVACIADHRADGGTVILASHHSLSLPDLGQLPLADFVP